MAESRRGPTDGTDDLFDAVPGLIVHEFAIYDGEFDEQLPPDKFPSAEPTSTEGDSGAEDSACAPDDFAAWSTGEATAADGEIRIVATDYGLPLDLTIEPGQLHRDPDELAADLLRLCRVAAGRAGLARHRYLTGLGIGEDALRLLGLPTPEQVERSELDDEAAHDYARSSWLEHPQ